MTNAVYSSPDYTANAPVAVHGQAKNMQVIDEVVTISAALATTDTFNFGYLPPNAVVLGGWLKASAMDTNGSPTLTLSIAIGATAVYTASTIGRAGGTDTTGFLTGARGLKTTAKTAVTGTVPAAAATGAAGTLELHIAYCVVDSPTTP